MISRVQTAIYEGIEGKKIWIEADISRGLPSFNIVGLAGASIKESHERVKSAIINSGFEYPRGRLTINLLPAYINKRGSHMDLPIAISILAAEGLINEEKLNEHSILGELSLGGSVMPICGALPMVYGISNISTNKIIVPYKNIDEAMLTKKAEIIPVSSLRQCVDYLNGYISDIDIRKSIPNVSYNRDKINKDCVDFSEVNGQVKAKRAACIAASGGHGMIMIGPPGCGKTMIARRIPTIMPDMDIGEIIETTMIYSVAGKLNESEQMIDKRPFRMPYQRITQAGLLGGGLIPRPGEISLAHNGILFLDEVCEFNRDILEKIRIPIEEHEVSLNRGGKTYRFPANVIPIAASNPCPCGYLGDSKHKCKCTPLEIERYRKKLSGPILDRIDLQIYMEKVKFKQIASKKDDSISTKEMRNIVMEAKDFASIRNQRKDNASLDNDEILSICKLGREDLEFLNKAYDSFALSPRSVIKVLKVARTIADIGKSRSVKTEHISEALNYRVISDSYIKR